MVFNCNFVNPSNSESMACKDVDTSKMDESVLVKGCLGRLPCSVAGKNRGSKKDNIVSSPRAKLVSKPSAVVLPSPRQHIECDENYVKNNNQTHGREMGDKHFRQDAIKGQLSLSFHIDGETIFAQVLEARNLRLRSPFQKGDGYYIAIELSDAEGYDRQTTKAVYQNPPIFNEEFIFEQYSSESRLVISLYKSNSSGCDEMVGCMSFGLSNLLLKYSSHPEASADSYILLNRILGMKKHLRTSQVKHLNLLANMSGISSLSSMVNQGCSLLRRTIVSSKSSDCSTMSTLSSQLTSNGSIRSNYSSLPSDSMWSYYKAIYCSQNLNSTPKIETPKRGEAPDILRNHFDSCSLSSVSWNELSSCPSQGSFNKFSNVKGKKGKTGKSSVTSDSDSSLKLADLASFGSGSKSNIVSFNNTDSLPLFPRGASREEEVCLHLIHAENKFISLMHRGVLRFSRPLSYGILTSSEHKTLFQNVEKLLAISEFHLKQLSDSWTKSKETIRLVGKIYRSQLATLCESYLTYFRGLSAADEQLTQLLQRASFAHFLSQDLPDVPDIRLDTFLQAPQKHLQDLMCTMDDIVCVADPHLEDFQSLLDVQKALTACWKQCTTEEPNNHMVDDVDEGIYEELDERQMMDQHAVPVVSANGNPVLSEIRYMVPSSSCTQNAQSLEKQRNVQSLNTSLQNVLSQQNGINSDLMQLVDRLQFSDKVKPFQLAAPGRHIVFSGEMDFVDNWKWVKAQVFLMNDVIIVTKREPDSTISIIAEPIFLKDVTSTDFECLHPGEILLVTKTESREHPWSHMRTITFRTSTPGLKVTWQHLLMQRICNINGPPRTVL